MQSIGMEMGGEKERSYDHRWFSHEWNKDVSFGASVALRRWDSGQGSPLKARAVSDLEKGCADLHEEAWTSRPLESFRVINLKNSILHGSGRIELACENKNMVTIKMR